MTIQNQDTINNSSAKTMYDRDTLTDTTSESREGRKHTIYNQDTLSDSSTCTFYDKDTASSQSSKQFTNKVTDSWNYYNTDTQADDESTSENESFNHGTQNCAYIKKHTTTRTRKSVKHDKSNKHTKHNKEHRDDNVDKVDLKYLMDMHHSTMTTLLETHNSFNEKCMSQLQNKYK